MSHCIVIPTFNNRNTLAQVVNDASRYADCVIVVNDGSTDDTLNVLGTLGNGKLRIVSYNQNKGKGHALLQGFKKAEELGFDYAVTMDSDGQHFAEDIPNLLAKIGGEDEPYLVLGSRNIDTQENMPGKNSFANNFSNFWFKVETGLSLPDTQCGFRIYPVKEVNRMHVFSTKYEAELEMLVRLAWRGVKVVPCPIKVYYAPEGERVSHFRPFKDFSRISILNTILSTISVLYIKPRNLIRKWVG